MMTNMVFLAHLPHDKEREVGSEQVTFLCSWRWKTHKKKNSISMEIQNSMR